MFLLDFIIRKLPVKIVLWLVRSKFGKRDLNTFVKFLSSNNWEKVSDNPEKWIFMEDNSFAIEVGEQTTNEKFSEQWIEPFPDKNTKSKEVYLKINGERIVKPLLFVSADGGRYFIPLPKIGEAYGKRYYYWQKDSLDYKVCNIIGDFYREKNLEGVGKFCGVLLQS